MTDDEREPQHGGTKGCPQKKLDTMEGASQVRKRNYSPRRVQWAKTWGWWADRQPVKSKRRGSVKPRDIEEQYIKLFLGGEKKKKWSCHGYSKTGRGRQAHDSCTATPIPSHHPFSLHTHMKDSGLALGLRAAVKRRF